MRLQPIHDSRAELDAPLVRVRHALQGFFASIGHLGTKLLQQSEVIKHDSIVASLLIGFKLSGVNIVPLIVPEAPAHRHMGFRISEPEEVLTAYPPLLVVKFPSYAVTEKPQSLPVEVVGEIPRKLAVRHRLVRHSTTASEQVIEVLHATCRHRLHKVVHQHILASLVWYSVIHYLPFFFIPYSLAIVYNSLFSLSSL